MLYSEEFFEEFMEELEIEASCPECGKATLSMLLLDRCGDCPKETDSEYPNPIIRI